MKHNLLIWKRREIENYFLEPEYLFNSKYCRVSQDKIKEKILKFANNRLLLDVSNYVITSIREELKQNWIKKFTDPTEFSSKETALNKLKSANEFELHQKNVEQKVSQKEVECRFNNFLNQMSGGNNNLTFDSGNWLAMIQGKKVLTQVINSECFQVLDNNSNHVNGQDKINTIVKELLQKDESIQPEDFLKLKNLVESRITRTG